ncbi:MAG: heparinase II/III family protein [Thermoguttaceae bacterium]
MSLFLTKDERRAVLDARAGGDLSVHRFWTALMRRVDRRASSPGLVGQGDTAAWWHLAAEYVTDAAMAYALQPTEQRAAWLRDVTLSIARRPVSDWVGPFYRDHAVQPPQGHLETAHLCWAVAVALDLATDVFSGTERDELRTTLSEKGIVLCRRWLERNNHLANWRSVLTSGVAVAAAVLGDFESLRYAAQQTHFCAQAFQPDGSYAESLQYANYLANAMMMASEAVHRAAPEVCAAGPEVNAKSMFWIAASMLYATPLDGWGAEPRARAVNFNDSGAIYRPSADVVLQVAARCRETFPREAGLARWLFDTFYLPVPSQEPHDLATFGMRNDWGFLTLPLLVRAAKAISPAEAGLPLAAGFDNGNILIRDAWDGRTVLAVQGGSGPLCGPGHLHGDRNSFVLAHNRQRLLVDPGHSCYRNLIHGLESSSQTHNTCTFLVQQDVLGLQEDLAKAALLEQSNVPVRRLIVDGTVAPPASPRGRRLLLERCGGVTAVASEAGSLYGRPIDEFTRIWLQCGPHVLLVVDRIRASQPVTTMWNWLFNHRDAGSDLSTPDSRTIVLRRGLAGLKAFHLADGRLHGPTYAYVHDAYHPEPDQLGEGRPGSGMLYRWIEPESRAFRVAVHAFAMDDYGEIDAWSATAHGGDVEIHRGPIGWRLTVSSKNPFEMILRCSSEHGVWRLRERDERFSFEAIEES